MMQFLVPSLFPTPKSWSSLTPVSHSRPESGSASRGGHNPLGVAGPGLDLGRTEQHLVSQGAFLWTSLVVQWLRFRAPSAQGAWVRSLVRELNPTCHN